MGKCFYVLIMQRFVLKQRLFFRTFWIIYSFGIDLQIMHLQQSSPIAVRLLTQKYFNKRTQGVSVSYAVLYKIKVLYTVHACTHPHIKIHRLLYVQCMQTLSLFT